MPNWCNTTIVFYGDKKIVKDFYNKLTTCLDDKESIISNGFGVSWLGNILGHVLGKEYVKKNISSEEVHFRGYITHINNIDEFSLKNGRKVTKFTIDTTTAWSPCIKMWYKIFDKLYPRGTIDIAYIADEVGCQLHQIHDPEHLIYDTEELYYIDKHGEINDYDLNELHDVYTKKELIAILKEVFTDFKEIKSRPYVNVALACLLNKFNESIEQYIKSKTEVDDCWFNITEYEMV